MAGRKRHGDPDAVVSQWRNGRLGIKSQAEIEADRRAELRVAGVADDEARFPSLPIIATNEVTISANSAKALRVESGEGSGLLQINAYDFMAAVVGLPPAKSVNLPNFTSLRFWADDTFTTQLASIVGGVADLAELNIGEFNVAVDGGGNLAIGYDTGTFAAIVVDQTTGAVTIGSLIITTLNTGANTNLGDSQSDLTTIFGKRTTAGNAPGVAIGAAAGTGATVGTITGNDISGRVVLNTGTSPGTGTLCTVTFNTPYAATPKNIGANQASATGGVVDLYTTSITASSFVIGCSDAPAASSTITVGWSVD